MSTARFEPLNHVLTDLAITNPRELLLPWQERLHGHFAELHAARVQFGAPVFALEHGLDSSEIGQMSDAVRALLSRGRRPPESWLPLVVYASEIGYHYSGLEYWETFESSTPGWAEHGKRSWIREGFRRFQTEYDGARPAGAWADWFSIISWPITHAILPSDLQRQLAKLLYANRWALGTDLLDEPAQLGSRLAARSWGYSARFRVFCENTELLGRVAAALLSEEKAKSDLILDSTLRRIVADLSKERQAAAWLRDAKSAATRIRVRGFQSGSSGMPQAEGKRETQNRLQVSLYVARRENGWTPYIEFPDLTSLADHVPEIATELRTLRGLTSFRPSRPLSRGQLVFPGQRLAVTHWPDESSPLIELERGSELANGILASHVVAPGGDRWLFELADQDAAREVRSGRLRAERSYVLLCREDLPTRRPDWIARVDCDCEGLVAYEIRTPKVLNEDETKELAGADLAFGVDVEISPLGIAPAQWDGVGFAEWIASDEPMVCVQATREVRTLSVDLDGEAIDLDWPSGASRCFLSLGLLEAGSHSLRVSLQSAEDAEPFASGELSISIREPTYRPLSGGRQEGMMIVPSPARPTLSEVWEARAEISVLGPIETDVQVTVEMMDHAGQVVESRSWKCELPIFPERWRDDFDRICREDPEFGFAYDIAESCKVTVRSESVGDVSLEFDREFTALRWVCRRDRSGTKLRLIDNTDGEQASVSVFPFDSPDQQVVAEMSGDELKFDGGGLAVASCNSVRAEIIAPRRKTKFHGFDQLQVSPSLHQSKLSRSGVQAIVANARAWWDAPVPSDPLASSAKAAVIRALVDRVSILLGGSFWRVFEQRVLEPGLRYSTDELQQALGDKPDQRRIAPRLEQLGRELIALDTTERVRLLARALADYVPQSGFKRGDDDEARALIQLAGFPGILGDSRITDVAIERALANRTCFQAARFFVLQVNAAADLPRDWQTYGGWTWE